MKDTGVRCCCCSYVCRKSKQCRFTLLREDIAHLKIKFICMIFLAVESVISLVLLDLWLYVMRVNKQDVFNAFILKACYIRLFY